MAGNDDVQRERQDGGARPRDADQLVVAQTATGYWVVRRGDVQLAGAVTQRAAERERERMRRLASRSPRRTLVRA
jgi:hypothetical protein